MKMLLKERPRAILLAQILVFACCSPLVPQWARDVVAEEVARAPVDSSEAMDELKLLLFSSKRIMGRDHLARERFAAMSLEQLRELATCEDMTLAIRALDELYLRRSQSVEDRSRFVTELESLLGIDLPNWARESIQTGTMNEQGTFTCEALNLSPYPGDSNYSRDIGKWYVELDPVERVIHARSPSGQIGKAAEVKGDKWHAYVTGTESGPDCIACRHTNFPEFIYVICFDGQTGTQKWRTELRHVSPIVFWAIGNRTFLTVHSDESKIVVMGMGVSIPLFLEILDKTTGTAVARYSSAF